MTIIDPNNRKDLYRAIIALAVIITCAILIGIGKVDISVFIVVISNVTTYYLGKSSTKGSLVE